MVNRFSVKVAIITGGGSGIGEATARRFVEEGASVVIADRMKDKIERVAESLPKDWVLVQVVDVAFRPDRHENQ